MSLILVVEQEGRYIERIHDALSSEGWRAKVVGGQPEALRAASSEAPSLVLVNSDLEGAASLYSSFARKNGGPGVIALVPERKAGELTAERLEVDAVLAKPFTDQDLRLVVRRGLAEARQPPSRPAPAAAGEDGDGESRFTSQDIFGDLVAEIEGEIAREEAAATLLEEPASRPAVSAPAPPAPPPAAATARPTRDLDDIDLNRRLEETLSGVLSVDRLTFPAAPPPRRKSRDVDVDALLNETLTGLRLGTLGKDRGAAKPSAPAADKPAPAASGELFGTLDLRDQIAGLADRPPRPRPAESAPAADPLAADQLPAAEPGPPAEEASPAELPGPEESLVPEEVLPAAEALAAEELGAEEATPVFDLTSDGPLMLEPPPLEEFPPPSSSPAGQASAPPAAAAPAVGFGEGDGGQQFGQYALLERIAVGGMAEVWKARMRGVEGFQKTVAIKKILPHLTDNGDFVSMFIDEAKLAAQLSHPNIIHIYDLGKIGENFYIAMEYVEGKNLRAILNAARDKALPMPVDLALLVGARLASALDYAHRKRDFNERELGLVHRDVSPQNVLISYEGDIKLCDFGIAKAVAKASQTQMGALKGKLQYMSPEQAWGRAVDARSDIFSLGSLLFEALTGQRLFVGDNEISVLEAVRECKVEDPRAFNPEVPAEASDIVLRALAKDPDDRYANAGELQHALEQLLYTRRPAPGPADLATYVQRLSAAKPAPPAPPGEAPSAVEVAPAPPVEPPAASPVEAEAPVEEAAALPTADDDEALELPPEVLAPLGGEAPAAGEGLATLEMPVAGKGLAALEGSQAGETFAAEEAGAGTASRAGGFAAGEWTATGSRPGVAAVAPVGAVEVDDGGRGRWILIGAILFFVLAGIAAYFYLRTVRSQPPAVPPAAGAVEEEIVTPLPADEGTPSGEAPADAAGEAAPVEEGGAPPV